MAKVKFARANPFRKIVSPKQNDTCHVRFLWNSVSFFSCGTRRECRLRLEPDDDLNGRVPASRKNRLYRPTFVVRLGAFFFLSSFNDLSSAFCSFENTNKQIQLLLSLNVFFFFYFESKFDRYNVKLLQRTI